MRNFNSVVTRKKKSIFMPLGTLVLYEKPTRRKRLYQFRSKIFFSPSELATGRYLGA